MLMEIIVRPGLPWAEAQEVGVGGGEIGDSGLDLDDGTLGVAECSGSYARSNGCRVPRGLYGSGGLDAGEMGGL